MTEEKNLGHMEYLAKITASLGGVLEIEWTPAPLCNTGNQTKTRTEASTCEKAPRLSKTDDQTADRGSNHEQWGDVYE